MSKTKTQAESKETKKNVILEVYKYFLPSAFKKYKGYFAMRVGLLVADTVWPFVSILVMPMVIDELMNGRNITKIMNCIIFIILSDWVLGILSGTFRNVI